MLALTFQGPGEVRVDDVPEPRLEADDDAVVRITTTAVCGSDLHILHGRHPVEQGFVLGHEFVGEVVDAGDAVSSVAPGDRVLGCFVTACGSCWFCERGVYPHCVDRQIFGHGEISGNLPGAQAEMVRVPHADVTLRPVPEGLGDDPALFAGDVVGTAVHGVHNAGVGPGDVVAVLGAGPVGLCAIQTARRAGAAQVLAIDAIDERLEMARRFGAEPIHLTEQEPRAEVKRATEGRGADATLEAVGSPQALESAIYLTRAGGAISVIGVHNARCEVHMGLAWNKSLQLRGGPANVVGHVDDAIAALSSGELDPTPLIQRRMPLAEAAEAYAAYDRREALKIVLTP